MDLLMAPGIRGLTSGPVLGATGLRRYRELSPSAADVVSRRFLAERGADFRQFGARGHEACRADLAYHLVSRGASRPARSRA